MDDMIPKIIHYCWFGGNKKSKLIMKCIESWKKYFPDYEIMEWNEENSDINENEYVREAYRLKKWAYVSDYIRMKVLYEYGGIYFDTDVEVIRKYPQEILELPSFTGIEAFSRLVNPGLVYGCLKGDSLVKEVIDSYQNDKFIITSPEEMLTINKRISGILDKYGYIREDTKQTVNGLTIFPSEVFCAYDGQKRCIKITDNTVSVHHYTASWLPWYRKIRCKIGTVIRHMKYGVRNANRT